MSKFKFFKKDKSTTETIDERRERLHLECIEMLEQAIPGTDEYDKLLANLEKYEEIRNKKEELKNQVKVAKKQFVTKTLIEGAVTGGLGTVINAADQTNPITGKVETKIVDKVLAFMKH